MKKSVFVLGAHGRLGAAVVSSWQERFTIISLGRKDVDLSDPEAAYASLAAHKLSKGDLLINSAAMTDVDGCERDPDLAMKINAFTPKRLAQLAAERGARFLQVSTDYVFDGTLDRPYQETDTPHPLSHYGASKLAGEEAVLEASPDHVIARVSWVFGPDRPSFIDQILARALSTDELAAVDDKTSSPAYTKDLAAAFEFFINPEAPGGIFHLCNPGTCSWREYGQFALEVAARHGMPVKGTSVAPLKLSNMTNFLAQRPQHSALDTTKFTMTSGLALRPWQEAVEEYIKEKAIHYKASMPSETYHEK